MDPRSPNSGEVVTIMHVDVEGSTRLTTARGDEVAQRVLAETKQIVRERAEASKGREIDAVGDAMMLTFASPRSAITGAMAVQEAIAARERERPEETLRVRIGLNVGEVLERDGHPFGAAVNAGAPTKFIENRNAGSPKPMTERSRGMPKARPLANNEPYGTRMSNFADLPNTPRLLAKATTPTCASLVTLSSGRAGSVSTLPFA